MAESDRPSPDALLAEANRERRGRLKIFLGAAPGVGKTYAMLEAARDQKREHVDVVIGIVETHGRRDTQALVEGLEELPRKPVEYRDRVFPEMDLDAILKRRPRLVLVDELAHTNVPGSRHLKRHQDVAELLAAGIDVYSTLNVQHLESLNDVVERIAGVTVRETVPDGVLQTADEIELIDLPPQTLIKRLAEGKVYVPEQARRAVDHFFSAGTLTALREMALRVAAERVDAQMVSYMRAHAIPGPWPTRERILVCVGPGTSVQRLVRTAKRTAERRQAPWMAVHVETYRHASLDEETKTRISEALRLAEQLGAETMVIQGDDTVAELLDLASTRNVSQIIVGRAERDGWLPFRHRNVTAELLARADRFDVTVVAGDDEPRRQLPVLATRQAGFDWTGYAVAAAATAAASALGYGLSLFLDLPNISLIYLMAVLLVAIRHGLGPSIAVSVASFLAYNFFFTDPLFTLDISDTRNILTVVFFLITAFITSNLAARVRMQVESTRTSARRTTNLYDFSRRIAAAANQDDVLWAVVHHVAATLRGRSLILLPERDSLTIKAGFPPEDRLDDKARAAADWAWSHGQPAGRGSTTLPTSEWLFLPLKTGRAPVGVLGVQIEAGDRLLSPEENRLLDTLADQAALAIERTSLVSDIEQARLAAETERLRSALLSSLSHDLRTPLASILGASSSLISYDASLNAVDRLDLAQTIQDEAERLNRFVQNLLDMTRLGSGQLKPRADWVDPRDIIASAVERAGKLLRRRAVKVEIDPALPLLRLDPMLMEQVIFNLLDNACKYSPAGTPITIWTVRRDDTVLIEVCDQGPGIPEEDRERVFDMFYRVEDGDSRTAGTGLGLAICRGIIEAHGGRVSAQPGLNGAGTCVVMRLPVPAPAELVEPNPESA
ncbi:histidine kinase [Skermanella stibiiresistens SB22]|uniref:histidine kinase n=1 Tax=Skermanella stibiiresistens SB22 TaxID=1385369 RepID=W9H856_9PROT|nr:sensor histidine kinase KdpD [Skermanella stibiiresistens]EWY42435.1 histidine kinase [Skermanella stibiiresistens SB22]